MGLKNIGILLRESSRVLVCDSVPTGINTCVSVELAASIFSVKEFHFLFDFGFLNFEDGDSVSETSVTATDKASYPGKVEFSSASLF